MPMSPRLLRPRAAGGFDPRAISGLALWLDASDSSSYTLATGVSEWRDKSGNGHSYTQAVGANQPLVVAGPGGRNCLDFDGANDRLVGGASTLGLLRNVTGCTLYVARKADTNDATRGVINWAQSTSATRRLGIGLTSTAYRADNFWVDANQGQVLPTYTATPATAWEVQSVRIICGTNPGAYQRLNGSDVASANWIAATPPSASSDTDSFDAHVGFGVIAGSSAYWDGQIGEVLMWQRVLTNAEIAAIDQYLAAKWGIYPYGPPPNYADADVNAYINAVELADRNHLETAVRDAINDFIVGCKADGIWSAIKASCILMGARTLSGALTPLVGSAPTNNGPFVSGDYDRKTGLLSNGSTKFLNSNRANNADGQNDQHVSFYASVLPASDTSSGVLAGAGGSGVGATNIGLSTSFNTFYRSRCTAFSTSGSHGASYRTGFHGISRSISSEYISRFNATNATRSVASDGVTSDAMFIFARNNGSGTATNHVAARLSFYSIGSAVDLALLDSRISTLYSAIGAAI